MHGYHFHPWFSLILIDLTTIMETGQWLKRRMGDKGIGPMEESASGLTKYTICIVACHFRLFLFPFLLELLHVSVLRSLWDDSDEKSGLMVLSHVKKKLTARTRETQGFHG
ncbi:hypothetical protein AV530_000533 [Patagioenas fasciata monilis]|uniref:Uncharacterized protein n=1 Tax=Patagioenas fasciata monilis TaxID=372326 RepID=A0A1V4IFT2_PATFA|nr:hypothetical protein AV530_000533 [Patagioenas fasciata monilis]